MQDAGEGGVLGVPDVLAHLDGGDGVVRAPGLRPLRDVPVVDVLHLHQLLQPACRHLPPYVRGLFGGERDGGDADAVVLSRVQGQRTPAAADVQQPCAGPQSELAADQLQLVALGVGGPVAGGVAGPVAAGVRHGRVEEQGVEGVGQVVVVADRRPVPGLAVQRSAQPGPCCGNGRAGPGGTEAQGGPDGGEPVGEREHGRGEPALAHRAAYGTQHIAQVGAPVLREVEVTGDVRLGQAEFAGRPEQPAQGAPGAYVHGRGALGPGLAAVPHPYADGQRTPEQPLGQGDEPLGGAGGGACGEPGRGGVHSAS